MAGTDYKNLEKVLDEQLDWPSEYLFKFIVPRAKKDELAAVIPADDITFRESKNGSYFSLTVRILMQSSSDVIALYKKTEQIQGVMIM